VEMFGAGRNGLLSLTGCYAYQRIEGSKFIRKERFSHLDCSILYHYIYNIYEHFVVYAPVICSQHSLIYEYASGRDTAAVYTKSKLRTRRK